MSVARPLAALVAALLGAFAPVHAQSWVTTLGSPATDTGYEVAQLPGGDAVVVGTLGQGQGGVLVARLDGATGDPVWTRTLTVPGGLLSYGRDVAALPDGGVVVFGSRQLAGHHFLRPWLVRLDADGATVWTSDDTVTAAVHVNSALVSGFVGADGTLVFGGGRNTYTQPQEPWGARATDAGALAAVAPLGLTAPYFVGVYISEIVPAADGGMAVAGYTGPGGGGFLARIGPDGALLGRTELPASQMQYAYGATPLADGGTALAGTTADGRAAVARFNAAGALVWTAAYAAPFYAQARDVAERPDGSLLVLTTQFEAYGSTENESAVLLVDADGTFLNWMLLRDGFSTGAPASLAGAALAYDPATDTFVAVGTGREMPGQTFDIVALRSSFAGRLIVSSDAPPVARVLRAWPNPTRGEVSLAGTDGAAWTLADALGREVRTGRGDGRLDAAGLTPGVYVLRVEGRPTLPLTVAR